jgi:hypothetical protein
MYLFATWKGGVIKSFRCTGISVCFIYLVGSANLALSIDFDRYFLAHLLANSFGDGLLTILPSLFSKRSRFCEKVVNRLFSPVHLYLMH